MPGEVKLEFPFSINRFIHLCNPSDLLVGRCNRLRFSGSDGGSDAPYDIHRDEDLLEDFNLLDLQMLVIFSSSYSWEKNRGNFALQSIFSRG